MAFYTSVMMKGGVAINSAVEEGDPDSKLAEEFAGTIEMGDAITIKSATGQWHAINSREVMWVRFVNV